MSYTDKEMQLASQIAYVNVTNETLDRYFKKYGKEPTLRDLFLQDAHGDLYQKFMEGHKENPTGVDIDRKEAAIKFWDDIVNGNSPCSN